MSKKKWTLAEFIEFYLDYPDPDNVYWVSDETARRVKLKEKCTYLRGEPWAPDYESAMYAGMEAGSQGLKIFMARLNEDDLDAYLAHGVDEDDAVRRLAAALDFDLPEAE